MSDKLTLEDIDKAWATVRELAILPIPCSKCGKKWYLQRFDWTFFQPNDENNPVLTCGECNPGGKFLLVTTENLESGPTITMDVIIEGGRK